MSSREWVLVGPGRLELLERPLLGVSTGRVRVRFLFCAICGSDITKYRATGETSPRFPLSLGHEFLAEVVAVGPSARSSFSVGDLVTSDLNFRCGACDPCNLGRSHLCVERSAPVFSNRGFAEFADISSDILLKVGQTAGPHMALVEPLSCVLHAREWALNDGGDRVLVVGAGGLGLCLAFELSQDPVIGRFDLVDEVTSRRALIASAAGAAVRALAEPDGHYDVVFDLSGTTSGLQLACAAVADGGRLCSMSHLDGKDASFLLAALTRRDVTFKVSYLNGQVENLARAARLLEERFHGAWLNTLETLSFEHLSAAFERHAVRSACKTVVEIGT